MGLATNSGLVAGTVVCQTSQEDVFVLMTKNQLDPYFAICERQGDFTALASSLKMILSIVDIQADQLRLADLKSVKLKGKGTAIPVYVFTLKEQLLELPTNIVHNQEYMFSKFDDVKDQFDQFDISGVPFF